MLQETGRKLRYLLLVLLTVVFVCFAVLNRQFIVINLFPLPYSAKMPEFIFGVICFALGIVVGGVFKGLKLSRMGRLLKKEHKHVMALENEIQGMQAEKNALLPAVVPKP